jgi:tRNA A37 threonylcarbamoyladenosine synthetase subunit TsaC/SUA5/YrdC
MSPYTGILCRSLQDVATYTLGWPNSAEVGDTFKIAKRLLPGPYTFVLSASKRLPAQVTDFNSKTRRRRTEVRK